VYLHIPKNDFWLFKTATCHAAISFALCLHVIAFLCSCLDILLFVSTWRPNFFATSVFKLFSGPIFIKCTASGSLPLEIRCSGVALEWLLLCCVVVCLCNNNWATMFVLWLQNYLIGSCEGYNKDLLVMKRKDCFVFIALFFQIVALPTYLCWHASEVTDPAEGAAFTDSRVGC